MSSSLRKKSSLYKSPQKPADSPDLPTAGDEDEITRLVSSVGTPEAVREKGEQVKHEETSQKYEDDSSDSATVDGDELDAVIEEVMNIKKKDLHLKMWKH